MSKSTKSAASTTPCLKEFFDPESKKRALSVIEQKKKELIALADVAGVGMGIMVASSEGEVTEVLASLSFPGLHTIIPQTGSSLFEQLLKKILTMEALVGSNSVKSEADQRAFLLKLICEIQWRHGSKHLPKIPSLLGNRFKALKERSRERSSLVYSIFINAQVFIISTTFHIKLGNRAHPWYTQE